MSTPPQVLIRVREQPMGGYAASADMPDGRRIRVCGKSTSDKSTVVGLLKQTITWVRRGSPS